MSIKPGLNFTVEELDYIGRRTEERFDCWGTAEILNSYKSQISVGLAMDEISGLGNLHRQLLQESDFHSVKNVLLKRLSPEEENEKFTFDGSKLPPVLKSIILELDKKNIPRTDLIKAIRLVDNDVRGLMWIINNWEEFVPASEEDPSSVSIVDVSSSEDSYTIVRNENRQSKDHYSVREFFRKNKFKEASERRIHDLKVRLRSIQSCHYPEELEKELGNIRMHYYEDKKLLEHWSKDRRIDDRDLYLSILYRRGLDLETIRRKLWIAFDKETEPKITIETTRPLRPEWIKYVDPISSKLSSKCYLSKDEINAQIKAGKSDPREFVESRFVPKPPIWDIEKSKALCELNQTRQQWNDIYSYAWKRMSETIAWKLMSIRKVSEGGTLPLLLRKYHSKLDYKILGNALISKAKEVETVRGKNLIYSLISEAGNRLEEEVKIEIIKIMAERSS
jgi:hypothetical protein